MRMYEHACPPWPREPAGAEGYTAAVILCSRLNRTRFRAIAVALLFLFVAAFSAEPNKRSRSDRTRDLKFAGEMARQGLWREAMFRWERLLRDEPNNPYLLNNVAVAKEALGDRAGAKAAYERAAGLANDQKLLANVDLFVRGEPKPVDDSVEPEGSPAPKPPEAP